MSPMFRTARILGFAFIVLGFGSIYTRAALDVDTVLTSWMGGAQPWSGIAMGVVGIVLVVVSFTIGRRSSASSDAGE